MVWLSMQSNQRSIRMFLYPAYFELTDGVSYAHT
jgi:hypothetical protein